MLRDPKTIPATDIIIEDPAMEPFFITKSSAGGYVVYERVAKGDKGKKYIKLHGYLSTFNNALKMVGRQLIHEDRKRYSTVKEYIDTYEDLNKKLQTITSVE